MTSGATNDTTGLFNQLLLEVCQYPRMGTIGFLTVVRSSIDAEGPRDHNARSESEVSTMSRRGMHPFLMGSYKPERKVEDKVEKKNDSGPSGLESAQHRRFLSAEAEDEKQAEAGSLR